MSASLDTGVLIDTLCPPSGAWDRVDVFPSVASTNAVSVAQPVPWRVVVAEEQVAGRGRRDRSWSSPVGSSVAMSMSVPLPTAAEDWGWLPLMTGLAVHDALTQLGGGAVEVALKWPNDVLIRAVGRDREPRKVCGILCEVTTGVVVAGVGINVSAGESDLPVPTATSLSLEGVAPPAAREAVIIGVAQAFARRFRELERAGEAVRESYRAVCSTIGADVTVHVPEDRTVAGLAPAVDDEGRLVVDVDGVATAFAAGDVVHIRRAEGA